MRDPNTVVVSVDPQHSAEARACRRYQAAGGPECRVIAVHVVATGGVAGTTVTGTGKCGDQILQSTATTNVPIPPVTGPTAKGQPADCVASVVQPGGGTINPTLTYTVTCIFVDP